PDGCAVFGSTADPGSPTAMELFGVAPVRCLAARAIDFSRADKPRAAGSRLSVGKASRATRSVRAAALTPADRPAGARGPAGASRRLAPARPAGRFGALAGNRRTRTTARFATRGGGGGVF